MDISQWTLVNGSQPMWCRHTEEHTGWVLLTPLRCVPDKDSVFASSQTYCPICCRHSRGYLSCTARGAPSASFRSWPTQWSAMRHLQGWLVIGSYEPASATTLMIPVHGDPSTAGCIRVAVPYDYQAQQERRMSVVVPAQQAAGTWESIRRRMHSGSSSLYNFKPNRDGGCRRQVPAEQAAGT